MDISNKLDKIREFFRKVVSTIKSIDKQDWYFIFWLMAIAFLLGVIVATTTYTPIKQRETIRLLENQNKRLEEELEQVEIEIGNAVEWLQMYNKQLTEEQAKLIYQTIKNEVADWQLYYQSNKGTRATELITADLVLALVLVESGAKANAVSSAGALGLTQVMPLHIPTLAHLDIHSRKDLLDTQKSIKAGVHILMGYASRTNHLYKALAYYNAGIGKYKYGIKYASKVKGLADKISS